MTAPTSVQVIEHALDVVNRHRHQHGRPSIEHFNARTLAHVANVSTAAMSIYLQDYRLRQELRQPGRRSTTKYVVACRGYGSAAIWYVLAQPGTDRVAMRRARVEATLWSVRDLASRARSDISHEVLAGLRNGASDPMIATLADQIDQTLDQLVRLSERLLNGGTP